MSEVDLVFAAIERHKVLKAECDRTFDIADGPLAAEEGRDVTKADEEASEAASAAEREAAHSLARMAPQTIAGMRASIEWYLAYNEDISPDDRDVFLRALLESPVLGGTEKNAGDGSAGRNGPLTQSR
jgi:predicted RNA-binding Zn ribbon-like protein